MAHVAPRRLGDVDGEIADALQVGVDFDRRHDRPQVHGHRLVERQELEAAIVDFDVQLIDGPIALEHARDDLGVVANEPVDRRPNPVLGEPAHLEKPGLELFELLLEVTNDRVAHGYPNLPVT